MSHLTHSRSLGDEPFQQIDYTDNEKTKLNQQKKIEKYKKKQTQHKRTDPVNTKLDCAQRAQTSTKAKISTKSDLGLKSTFTN